MLSLIRRLINTSIKFAVEDDEAENDDSNEDSDSKKKKKKREVTHSLEIVPEKKLVVKEKPFQWSNIFGLDRKKKSSGLIFHPLEEADKRRKRCEAGACDDDDYGKCTR
jgi:hypothetical protein